MEGGGWQGPRWTSCIPAESFLPPVAQHGAVFVQGKRQGVRQVSLNWEEGSA